MPFMSLNGSGGRIPRALNAGNKVVIHASDYASLDNFGYDLAVNGTNTRIAVGCSTKKSAYIFDLVGGVWTQTAKNASTVSNMGLCVDITQDGNTMVMGNEAGQAEVWNYSAGAWTKTQTLSVAGDVSLGYDVKFSADGTTLVVTSYNYTYNAVGYWGTAYVFTVSAPGGTWTQVAQLLPATQLSVRWASVSSNGSMIVLKGTQNGTSFFTKTGPSTYAEQNITALAYSTDTCVWMNDAGTVAYSGAGHANSSANDNQVAKFVDVAGTWGVGGTISPPTSLVVNSTTYNVTQQQFGHRVSGTQDGSTLAVLTNSTTTALLLVYKDGILQFADNTFYYSGGVKISRDGKLLIAGSASPTTIGGLNQVGVVTIYTLS